MSKKGKVMNVEIIDKELVVRLPLIENHDYSDIIRYLKSIEITSQSKATEEEIENLIQLVKKDRWKKFNAKRKIDVKNNN